MFTSLSQFTLFLYVYDILNIWIYFGLITRGLHIFIAVNVLVFVIRRLLFFVVCVETVAAEVRVGGSFTPHVICSLRAD